MYELNIALRCYPSGRYSAARVVGFTVLPVYFVSVCVVGIVSGVCIMSIVSRAIVTG